MSSQCLATTRKVGFFYFTQFSLLADPEGENKLKESFEPLKHRFFNINLFTFCDGQEAENEFKVTL